MSDERPPEPTEVRAEAGTVVLVIDDDEIPLSPKAAIQLSSDIGEAAHKADEMSSE